MTTSSPTPPEQAELDTLVSRAEREHRAGRLAEAAGAYRQIIALRPDNAEMHNYLGNVLLVQGQLDEAAAQYEQARRFKPNLVQALNNLGNVFRQQGQPDQAAARYRQVLALRPDLAEPHNNLGNVLFNQGQLDEAAVHYKQALAIRPDLAEPHCSLGNVLLKQGKVDEAATRYEQALALKPDLTEANYNLATVLLDQGKIDEAAAQFERAMAIDPDKFQSHNNLGAVFQAQGKFDDAAALYEQAIAIQADNAEAHYHRTQVKTFRAGDPDLAALEAIAADPNSLPPEKMVYIHFALGKALEDVGDYHRAFQHLLQGNALKRRGINYNEAGHQQDLQLIVDRFDRALLERFAGVGDPSPAPIFVLGMPRSGTTLVEQILASHPQVHAAGELLNLNRVIQGVSDASGQPLPFPQCISAFKADDFRRLGQAYLASLPTPAVGKTRITDKMPKNFIYVGLIRLILPNARIIHTLRNPVDTCVSCFSKLFTHGQPFSYDLAELGRYYRTYQEMMAHWRKVLPAGAMLDVSYEEVVDNLEAQARRLIDYCGLPWDDRCLSFHETSRPITTASNVQVRQPLYRSSVERWRRYEAYLQPLLAELDLDRQTQ